MWRVKQLNAVDSNKTTADASPQVKEPIKMRQPKSTLLRNTDKNMHATNPAFTSECFLCGQTDKYLVSHYVNKHPKSEVLISRLSQEMAQKLRDQSTVFQLNRRNKVVTGTCYFCSDENKKIHKDYWLGHLRSHTGENLFKCTKCRTKLPYKRNHKTCNLKDIISLHKQRKGFSILCYICNMCNYLQLTESRLVMHIKNEHVELRGKPTQFYEEYFLVKDPSIVETCSKYMIF